MCCGSPCWPFDAVFTAVRPKKKRTSCWFAECIQAPSVSLLLLCSFLNSAQFKGTLLPWLSKINNTAWRVYIRKTHLLCLPLETPSVLLLPPRRVSVIFFFLFFFLPFMCRAFTVSSLFHPTLFHTVISGLVSTGSGLKQCCFEAFMCFTKTVNLFFRVEKCTSTPAQVGKDFLKRINNIAANK